MPGTTSKITGDQFDKEIQNYRAEQANGTEAIQQLTPEQAAVKLLEAEANKRMEAYNNGLVALTEQTGFAVAPALEFPGGELVLLSSWLAATGIKANPRLKIVPK